MHRGRMGELGPPVAEYRVPLTCPHCGGKLRHQTSGAPVARTTVSAMARCSKNGCNRQWLLTVTMRQISRNGDVKL